MTSHWKYKNKVFDTVPDEAFGFVYRITNVVNNMKYVGRKYFGTVRRVKVNGRKNRRVVRKESNWRTYTGSSKLLQADIEKYGKSNFTFEVLAIANTKGQVNYLEEFIQFKLDVLFDLSYYNDSIGSRKFISMRTDPNFLEMVREISL